MLASLYLLLPEVFLSVLALGVLLGEAFFPSRGRLWLYIAVSGLVGVIAVLASFFFCGGVPGAAAVGAVPAHQEGFSIGYGPVFGMVVVDSQAVFFKIVILAAVVICLWLSLHHRELRREALGTYSGLMLMGTVGMMILSGASDLLVAVIALELVGIASFVLTGFVPERRTSTEAAIKLFLISSFSTAILLFGVSYHYGLFGTTGIGPWLDPASAADPLVLFVLAFLMAGLGFKLAMVPFHMWAPDAFEGAPTPVTAFLSVAPKAAAAGFLIRLLGQHTELAFTPFLAIFAALTMTVGNIGALHQTGMKRLLAYSSIAQIGYVLAAFVAGGALGVQAAMLYVFIYVFMNLGVFAVLMVVNAGGGGDDIAAFGGLAGRSLGLAVAVVVFLLSMTGIPPLAGFVGKFVVVAALIENPVLVWLAVLTMLNSVISLFYYFRIVREAFFRSVPAGAPALRFPVAITCALAVTFFVTVAAGLWPEPLVNWVRHITGS